MGRRRVENQLDADGFDFNGNGAFNMSDGLKASEFEDGVSKTALFSERIKGSAPGIDYGNGPEPSLGEIIFVSGQRGIQSHWDACIAAQPRGRGNIFYSWGSWAETGRWSNGWPFAGYACTQYNHMAPPNWDRVDCGFRTAIPDTPAESAIVTARSSHPGVVNVCYADGHVEPVSDAIELDVWRAIGSRNGGETNDTL